ncbi:hypothetical protein [Streptomyces sp. NPDC059893]|uniref:hypothetical protein n=1 Tax=Streptomyces sp. NPDC059893 TaxID=3346990 RepID=UPI00364EEB80
MPLPLDDECLLRHPQLAEAPGLCFWRALTDNGKSRFVQGRLEATGLAKMTRTLESAVRTGESAAPSAVVHALYTTAHGHAVRHEQVITREPSGLLRFDEVVVVPDELADVPRVGIVLATSPRFTHTEWTGDGPHECYPDRRAAALAGAWSAPVDDLAVPYIRPQENGSRSRAVTARLTAADGSAIMLGFDRPMQLNISRTTVADLAKARHA